MLFAAMGEGLTMVFVIPIAIVVTYFLLKWRAARGRAYMEQYIEEQNLDAEIVKAGIPPLRLWLRNRKGDNWVKLRSSDGSERWARIRTKFFGGEPVDFFD